MVPLKWVGVHFLILGKERDMSHLDDLKKQRDQLTKNINSAKKQIEWLWNNGADSVELEFPSEVLSKCERELETVKGKISKEEKRIAEAKKAQQSQSDNSVHWRVRKQIRDDEYYNDPRTRWGMQQEDARRRGRHQPPPERRGAS